MDSEAIKQPHVPTVPLQPVTSGLIHAIGHDPETNLLYVQFKAKAGPGSIYSYPNVPAEKHAAMMAAESIGKHFGAHIKDKAEHPFTKIVPGHAATTAGQEK